MLKLRVKLGEVSNLSDARYAAGMGVESIGFTINESKPGHIDAETVNTITEWVAGVKIVGETGESLPKGLEQYKLDFLEVSNSELLNNDHQYLFRTSVSKDNLDDLEPILSTNSDQVEYFVLDITPEQLADVGQELKRLARTYPIFISSEFSPQSLHYILEVIQPAGIELKGGIEEKPGFKDYSGIADILELLEED